MKDLLQVLKEAGFSPTSPEQLAEGIARIIPEIENKIHYHGDTEVTEKTYVLRALRASVIIRPVSLRFSSTCMNPQWGFMNSPSIMPQKAWYNSFKKKHGWVLLGKTETGSWEWYEHKDCRRSDRLEGLSLFQRMGNPVSN